MCPIFTVHAAVMTIYMLLCQDATPSVDVLFLKAFEKLGDGPWKFSFFLFNLPKGNTNTVCPVAFSSHHVYFSQ